jgi:mannose-6-phosphate isomerase-like protein (cupin superfamily)
VLNGRVVVRYADREETLEAGDAFYMAPGHAPEAEEGTELVQFSPTEQLAQVEAAIAAAARRP